MLKSWIFTFVKPFLSESMELPIECKMEWTFNVSGQRKRSGQPFERCGLRIPIHCEIPPFSFHIRDFTQPFGWLFIYSISYTINWAIFVQQKFSLKLFICSKWILLFKIIILLNWKIYSSSIKSCSQATLVKTYIIIFTYKLWKYVLKCYRIILSCLPDLLVYTTTKHNLFLINVG